MAAFGIPGGPELWIILAIALLLFGPTQLPKLAKMFGKSAKALKEGMEAKVDEDESASSSTAAKAEPSESKDPGE
jgi:sec-independent protein translocase protein TatA